jgi:hypothetical protein
MHIQWTDLVVKQIFYGEILQSTCNFTMKVKVNLNHTA